MVLQQLKLVGSNGVFNIGIEDEQITFVSKTPFAEFDDRLQLTFKNAIAFPGLINSHDHLDFNLFPQLGYKTYNNYVEWGKFIHQEYKTEIDNVLKVPEALRVKWGMYKNLLCGVTTVVDHGRKFDIEEPLITVFDNCQCLHSARLERDWKLKLNNPLKLNTPVVIHIGEGTDKLTGAEPDELTRWNILQRDLVGIHGVAMSAKQAKHFKALVWCPETNYFLLNKTAPVNELKENTTLLFGTDSTLTGHWDIWDHIRMARKTGLLTDEELYQCLTANAARIWNLNAGELAEGKSADIVVVKQHARTRDIQSFFETQPEDILLVMHKGSIRLFDESLLKQLARTNLDNFSRFTINGSHKYVQGNLAALMDEIHQYYPAANFPIEADHLEAV